MKDSIIRWLEDHTPPPRKAHYCNCCGIVFDLGDTQYRYYRTGELVYLCRTCNRDFDTFKAVERKIPFFQALDR